MVLGKKTRFLLLGFFSLMSYGFFYNVKNYEGDIPKDFFNHVFSGVDGLFQAAALLVILLFALWLSLVAASLAQSLLVGGNDK